MSNVQDFFFLYWIFKKFSFTYSLFITTCMVRISVILCMKGMIEAQIHPVYYPLIGTFYFFPFCWPSSCLIVKLICSVSDQKKICSQSWGHIETFSPKTSSQQPGSWSRMTWNTLYYCLREPTSSKNRVWVLNHKNKLKLL